MNYAFSKKKSVCNSAFYVKSTSHDGDHTRNAKQTQAHNSVLGFLFPVSRAK